MRGRGWWICLPALTLIAGCGSSTSKPSAPATAAVPSSPPFTYHAARARVPTCAHAGKAIGLPPKFPQNFPFPPGTAITGRRVPIGGGIAATGYMPSSSFNAGVRFFPRELKRARYKVLDLEIDAPHDSEGSYKGHGYIGGWAVRKIVGCPAMTIQVSAKRTP